MYWQDDSGLFIITGDQHSLPEYLELSESSTVYSFLIMNTDAVVTAIYGQFRQTSLHDEFIIGPLYSVVQQSLYCWYWSQIGMQPARWQQDIRHTGLIACDESNIPANLRHIIHAFQLNNAVFAEAFAAGQRSGVLAYSAANNSKPVKG
jgi:hypothetical protein